MLEKGAKRCDGWNEEQEENNRKLVLWGVPSLKVDERNYIGYLCQRFKSVYWFSHPKKFGNIFHILTQLYAQSEKHLLHSVHSGLLRVKTSTEKIFSHRFFSLHSWLSQFLVAFFFVGNTAMIMVQTKLLKVFGNFLHLIFLHTKNAIKWSHV